MYKIWAMKAPLVLDSTDLGQHLGLDSENLKWIYFNSVQLDFNNPTSYKYHYYIDKKRFSMFILSIF